MGTDIHVFAEKRNLDTGKFEFLPCPTTLQVTDEVTGYALNIPNYRYGGGKHSDTASWFDHRNYRLFAYLADVRNGRGFAGVKTGDGVVPFKMPVGWPQDRCDVLKEIWSDHSETYYMLDELILFLDCVRKEHHKVYGLVEVGVWDKFISSEDDFPESSCGGAYGPNVSVITMEQFNADREKYLARGGKTIYYVDANWMQSNEFVVADFRDMTDEMATYGDPKDIRVLIFFDS